MPAVLPITEEDKASPHYRAGVSCPACHDQVPEEKKRNFAERQKQIELAKARGEQHLGKSKQNKPSSEADGEALFSKAMNGHHFRSDEWD